MLLSAHRTYIPTEEFCLSQPCCISINHHLVFCRSGYFSSMSMQVVTKTWKLGPLCRQAKIYGGWSFVFYQRESCRLDFLAASTVANWPGGISLMTDWPGGNDWLAQVDFAAGRADDINEPSERSRTLLNADLGQDLISRSRTTPYCILAVRPFSLYFETSSVAISSKHESPGKQTSKVRQEWAMVWGLSWNAGPLFYDRRCSRTFAASSGTVIL